MYAKVENNQIVSFFHRIPSNYNNISGFDTLSDDELKTFNILPVVDTYPELLDYQTYGEPITKINSNNITRTYSVVQKDNNTISNQYTKALEDMYDFKAKEHRWDDRKSCALRAGYVNPFQVEATAFAKWMDNCNFLAYQIQAEVLAGTRPIPTISELLALMPTLVW